MKTIFLATQAGGQAGHYQSNENGHHYRISSIVAGIGRGLLEILDEHVEQCRAVFNSYYKMFADMPGIVF
jgi:pyridoxal phosphate-dependent aminotransferase EpsN